MALSEQIKRVDGSQNTILRALAKTFGITDEALKIDELAAAVLGSPKFRDSGMLSTATAALFGLGTDAVPDDVFAFLGKYNQYWWRRRSVSTKLGPETEYNISEYTDTDRRGFCIWVSGSSVSEDVVEYSDEIELTSKLEVVLKNPTTLSLSYETYTKASVLVGKYVKSTTGVIYKVPANSTPKSKKSSNYYVWMTPMQSVQLALSEWEYLQSDTEDAYPDSGIHGGYEYEYVGIPLSNAVAAPRVVTGSYIGTGTKGKDGACSLTFDFPPKVVFIQASLQLVQGIMGVCALPDDRVVANIVSSGIYDKTITWYVDRTGTNYEQFQCNTLGETYHYLAIG